MDTKLYESQFSSLILISVVSPLIGTDIGVGGLSQQGNNRVLLVNPPYYRLYKDTIAADNKCLLSLGYLAGSIREKSDWAVMVYNADFTTTSEPWTIRYLTGEGFETYRRNLTNISYKVWEEVGQR